MRGKARGGRRVCSASSGRFPCKGCCWVVQARNPNRATCAWHVLGHRAEPWRGEARRGEAGRVINAKLDVEASTRRRVRREHGRVTKARGDDTGIGGKRIWYDKSHAIEISTKRIMPFWRVPGCGGWICFEDCSPYSPPESRLG